MNSSTEASGKEIRVPRETVNDDVVIIAEWHVKDGAQVRAGDSLVDIETSKSVLEMVAGSVAAHGLEVGTLVQFERVPGYPVPAFE